MRVATFNINNINKRLDNLLSWLSFKTHAAVASSPGAQGGAGRVSRESPSDCGVQNGLARAAVLERRSYSCARTRSHLTRTSLPGNLEDHQARYIEAAVQGVLITSIYLPNGNPQPGPKFDYKLAWFERLIAHAAELMASGAPIVLAGDYNVVPTSQDIYPTRSLDNNALIQPESRRAFTRLLAQGWTDAMRKLHPNGPLWTFWDYKFDRCQQDKGMRLDQLCSTPNVAERLVGGGVDRWGPWTGKCQRPCANMDNARSLVKFRRATRHWLFSGMNRTDGSLDGGYFVCLFKLSCRRNSACRPVIERLQLSYVLDQTSSWVHGLD